MTAGDEWLGMQRGERVGEDANGYVQASLTMMRNGGWHR